MHLADPFLDAKTATLAAGAAATGLALALKRVRSTVEPRQMPVLGLAGAFIFAAQMLNFPIPGGTSGHLIGGVLAAILLGPSAAIIVLTCVLIVQCLMFADGGLLALGANVFNMAIVSVCGGYAAYRVVKRLVPRDSRRAAVFASAFAGWFGTVLSSVSCAGQLALSKTAAWDVTFPAMTNIHMIIGIGEGLATALVVMAVSRRRPDLLEEAVAGDRSLIDSGALPYALLVLLGLALFVAPFACSWPDGLETVAQKLGFANPTPAPAFPTILADYNIPWLGSPALATSIAGAIGAIAAFLSAYLLARVLVPLRPVKKDAPAK